MNKYWIIMGMFMVSCGNSGEVGNDQNGNSPQLNPSLSPTPSPTPSTAFYTACLKLSKCKKVTTSFNDNKCTEYNQKGKLLNTYYNLEELNKQLKGCNK